MFDFFAAWLLPVFILIVTYGFIHHAFLYDDIIVSCVPTERNKKLKKLCPILSQEKKYRYPMFFGWSSFLQIYYSNTIKKFVKLNYLRETYEDALLKEPITLDWVDNSILQGKPLTTPTVILLPGVTGTADSIYMQQFTDFIKNKYRVVSYSRPGCGTVKLTDAQIFLNTHPLTIRSLIEHVHNKLEKKSPLYVVGVSMGGANILRTIVDFPNLPIKGIITINQPLCHKNLEILETQPIYHNMMISCAKQIIIENEHLYTPLFKDHGGLQSLYAVTKMRDFDTLFMQAVHGVKDVENEYYKHRCMNRDNWMNIKIPTVAIQCMDDPVVQPSRVGEHLFEAAAKHNENLMVIRTEHGSHCSMEEQGWLRVLPAQNSLMERLGLQILDAFCQIE